MKALYSNEKECQDNVKENELKSWDYDTRYKALMNGYKYVHLFESFINEYDKKECKYYSTMQL